MSTYIAMPLLLLVGLVIGVVVYSSIKRHNPAFLDRIKGGIGSSNIRGVASGKIGNILKALVLLCLFVAASYVIQSRFPGLLDWFLEFSVPALLVSTVIFLVGLSSLIYAFRGLIGKGFTGVVAYFFVALLVFWLGRGLSDAINVDFFGVINETPKGNNLVGGVSFIEQRAYFVDADSTVLAVDVPFSKDGIVVLSPGGNEMHFPEVGDFIILEIYSEAIKLPDPYDEYEVGRLGAQEIILKDKKPVVSRIRIQELPGYEEWLKSEQEGQYAVCDECNLAQLLVMIDDRAWPVLVNEAVPVPLGTRDSRIRFVLNMPHELNVRGTGKFTVKFTFSAGG